jgi:hypothetical protein
LSEKQVELLVAKPRALRKCLLLTLKDIEEVVAIVVRAEYATKTETLQR